jgi:hypothetical protein
LLRTGSDALVKKSPKKKPKPFNVSYVQNCVWKRVHRYPLKIAQSNQLPKRRKFAQCGRPERSALLIDSSPKKSKLLLMARDLGTGLNKTVLYSAALNCIAQALRTYV